MRIKKPDHKNALSLVLESQREMDFILTLDINEHSASTVIRNIYECFRMLGDALLIKEGIEITNHMSSIDALTSLRVKTSRPLNIIDNLRRLRHNINYYGYHPSVSEAKDAVSVANSCFGPLLGYIKDYIK